MPGQLRSDHVWVPEQSEANRLYNRGHFGRPRSGGSLALDFVEAAFLLESGRLAIEDGRDGAWTYDRFYTEAATRQPEFEIRYLAYRDLRERGFTVRLAEGEPGVHFHLPAKGSTNVKAIAANVRAQSERTPVAPQDLLDFADACAKSKRSGLIAVVDEESEVTQYEVASEEPHGATEPHVRADAEATFLGDRCVVWDAKAAERLHGREFYGKTVAGSLHLSLVESLHLAVHGGLVVRDPATGKALGEGQLARLARRVEAGIDLRRRVFDDLKSRALIVKTGYKFGAHFRAYKTDPTSTHAPYLVHTVSQGDRLDWPTLSRAVRLAHGVRKTLLLAVLGKTSLDYVRLSRSR